MNMQDWFGLVAGVLSASCYVPYIRDILSGTTRPERATWLIWTVLGLILLVSQLAKGASASVWLTVAQTAGVTTIFLLSLKYGEGGLDRSDIVALAVAAAGLVAWYFTREASVALYIAIGVDFSGGILSVVKAYRDPESETALTWLIAAFAGVFGILAVGLDGSIALLAFPTYYVIISLMLYGAIQLGHRKGAPRA
jgi:hypothetical protein